MSSTTERILDSLERPTLVTMSTHVVTLRDQFAMAALSSALALHVCGSGTVTEAARFAYEIADAMLAARAVKTEGTV